MICEYYIRQHNSTSFYSLTNIGQKKHISTEVTDMILLKDTFLLAILLTRRQQGKITLNLIIQDEKETLSYVYCYTANVNRQTTDKLLFSHAIITDENM